MPIYSEHILPYLVHLSMRGRQMTEWRIRALEPARGRVLEIGAGSGLNLPLYGPEVTSVVGIEPSATLRKMAASRVAAARCPVELLPGTAEELHFSPASFDTVVSTWTMCSIAGIDAALAAMRRVLEPGGQLVFVEHGLSSSERIAKRQRRLTPLWSCVSGGCHLDRKIDELVKHAGFQMERLVSEPSGPLAQMYCGVARPSLGPMR